MYPPIFVDPSLYGYNPPSVYTFQPNRGHNAGAYMARQRAEQYGAGHPDRLRYQGVRNGSYDAAMMTEARNRAIANQLRQMPQQGVQQRDAPQGGDARDVQGSFGSTPRTTRNDMAMGNSAFSGQFDYLPGDRVRPAMPTNSPSSARSPDQNARVPRHSYQRAAFNLMRQLIMQRAQNGERPNLPSQGSRYIQRRPNQRVPSTTQPFAQNFVR